MQRLVIIEGDITKLSVDAIVNAANNTLSDGGGVNGAIHKAAGPELLAECRKLNGCRTGDARLTRGFRLPSGYVIHTVGPVWSGGDNNEDVLLASCYRKSLELAAENNIRTIAFPAISTGAFGFPVKRASRIAIKEIHTFFETDKSIEKVFVVCYNNDTYEASIGALKELTEL